MLLKGHGIVPSLRDISIYIDGKIIDDYWESCTVASRNMKDCSMVIINIYN